MLHALRGPTYALLFLTVPNLMLCGWYFWALIEGLPPHEHALATNPKLEIRNKF